jgi:hypothetical protein
VRRLFSAQESSTEFFFFFSFLFFPPSKVFPEALVVLQYKGKASKSLEGQLRNDGLSHADRERCFNHKKKCQGNKKEFVFDYKAEVKEILSGSCVACSGDVLVRRVIKRKSFADVECSNPDIQDQPDSLEDYDKTFVAAVDCRCFARTPIIYEDPCVPIVLVTNRAKKTIKELQSIHEQQMKEVGNGCDRVESKNFLMDHRPCAHSWEEASQIIRYEKLHQFAGPEKNKFVLPVIPQPLPQVFVFLPDGTPGFYFSKRESRRYGIPEIIRALREVGQAWAKLYPKGPRIRIGDISRRGGGPLPPHKSHRLGIDVDIGTIRKDSREVGCHIKRRGGKCYDQKRTQEMARLVMQNSQLQVHKAYFDDPDFNVEGIKGDGIQ